MKEEYILFCIPFISFIGWLVLRMMGNGFSVGGDEYPSSSVAPAPPTPVPTHIPTLESLQLQINKINKNIHGQQLYINSAFEEINHLRTCPCPCPCSPN